MKSINRGAFIVRPKDAFWQWASSVDETAPDQVPHVQDQESVYLVSEDLDDAADDPSIDDHFKRIFEAELFGWMVNPATWPSKRDLKTFNEWFDVYFQAFVWDLGSGPIVADE